MGEIRGEHFGESEEPLPLPPGCFDGEEAGNGKSELRAVAYILHLMITRLLTNLVTKCK